MAKVVLPRVQAMVLCDGVEESDQESGVYHLKGVRNVIEASSFPCTRSRFFAFTQMSGHVGEASCHGEINRAETDETVFRTPGRVIAFEGPLSISPVVFRLRNCGFPAPGVYYVQVFWDSKLIGERLLHLVLED
jgi:hypothetical protein